MSKLDEIKKDIAELEAKACQQSLSQKAPTEEPPSSSDSSVLWDYYVQSTLSEIMNDEIPVAQRVVAARSVLARSKRECYLPGYQVTSEDRSLLEETINTIKTTRKADGTVIRWIPGTLWTP